MRRLISAILIPAACLSLYAETTGRISGKVQTKDGKPIANATITLKRLDRTWVKELVSDKKGNFLQVGLDPKEFELTIKAEGFVEYRESIRIPLADVLVKNVTLLTPAEARTAAPATGGTQAAPEDPGAALDAAGRDAFNAAIPLYNEGKYEEALPQVDKAYKTLTEALTKLKDETSKAELAPELLKIERVLGICLAQAGAKKEEGEPYLLKALERNPKDERVIAGLIETSKAKADKAAQQKYTAMLEAIHGPNPDLIYNKGVESFNAGKMKEAKAQMTKVLEVDPKYARAHYLLGMVEYTNMNLKGTKQHFLLYLELAPTGDKAAEVREMLKDPSLKNIK
ncbi:MAG TPA: carboxypeptidase regulatory-like domain-containing protein [Geothrix sp.]|jgi:tetratricopeptide (TPR) repeat protein